MVDVATKESPEKVSATQEPTTLKIASDVQGAQWGTSSDKVRTEPLRNFIDLDSDKEEHHKEEILNLTVEVSILRMEVIKWKNQVEEYYRGMISLNEHRNIIRGLEENWAEERMTQRIQEEELQSNLRGLKKFKSMQ